MRNRSELRDIIIKILYQFYILDKAKVKFDIKDIIKDNIEIENDFVNEATMGITKNQEKIVEIANKYLKDWTIDRLSIVDKAIISLAIYEMMYTNTPPVVAINEAIELAHKYSDDSVVKMINATLDEVYHNEEIYGDR